MIPALIILFLSALFLVWQGTLPLEIGFALMALSVSAIIWKRIRRVQILRRIRMEMRERKAKWGGIMTVVSGLSSFTGMACHLFVTRSDELVVEDVTGIRIIPLSEIERMGLVYGKTLGLLGDRQLMKQLGFRTIPNFSSVRAWLERNPRARKRLLLVVRFQQALNELEYSEMVVFSDMEGYGNLRTFALRPEVAVKTVILPRRIKERNRTLRKVTAPVLDDRAMK